VAAATSRPGQRPASATPSERLQQTRDQALAAADIEHAGPRSHQPTLEGVAEERVAAQLATGEVKPEAAVPSIRSARPLHERLPTRLLVRRTIGTGGESASAPVGPAQPGPGRPR
jgi:hypothetical protein